MAELTSQSTSIQSLYGLFRSNLLYVNRRYQRKLVWRLEEKQKLIDSILQKYPIPAILVAEREDAPGTYEIIDGLQRLHAIISFIETTFPTLTGEYFNLEHFPTAKSAADEGHFEPTPSNSALTQRAVTTILDYTLAMSVMRNADEIEINDVFDRINTYGHRLSDQERRQAGVQNEFSEMIREIACELRGDVSDDILLLQSMPNISIDLPMSKHGYDVQADEVFWVTQGILRATDLRDSMDEQCLADIAACIIGGSIIERSKDTLDSIYLEGTDEAERIQTALEVYGSTRFTEELKFCLEEVLNACGTSANDKLRDIVYNRRTTNAFPSLFALILIAFHEITIGESKTISDYEGVRSALTGLSDRLDTSRRATSPDERRRNIDTIKGLIRDKFVDTDISTRIYGSHATTDIEASIRRSEIELADYELKQGMLSLATPREIDQNLIDKVAKTVCAIANNGPGRDGKILIGVCDKERDAQRIAEIDGVTAKRVGRRHVVGVRREATALQLKMEDYFGKWKEGLRQSGLSQPLLDSVLSNIDFNDFYGLGVIIIRVPPQRDLSYVQDTPYWRDGDETKAASGAPQIAQLARRF